MKQIPNLLEGVKMDSGKLQYSLLTVSLAICVQEIVKVLTFGATKYAPDNWKVVPDCKKRYNDALDRHLASWRMGEENDNESGNHHLAHAMCCALYLLWFDLIGEKK